MEMIAGIYRALFVLVFALVTLLICLWAVTASRFQNTDRKFVVIFCGATVAWFFFSLELSANGFYHSMDVYSPGDLFGLLGLVAFMIGALSVFYFAYRANLSLKRMIDGIDVKALIGIQAYRMCGTYFLFLAIWKKAPLLFALPTGILDLTVGTSALILPLLLAKKTGVATSLAKVWNYAGLLDFGIAFTIYFLYFPFHLLDAHAQQILIAGFFPISFIIIFPVPLAIILHALALLKLKQNSAPSF